MVSYCPLSQRVLEVHARTIDNYKWVNENWENIQKEHSDEFIVVADCQIVYSTNDQMNRLSYLSNHRDKEDMISVWVHPKDQVLIRSMQV